MRPFNYSEAHIDLNEHVRIFRSHKSLSMLKACLEDKTFHHATYRTERWCEGLYIYTKEDNRFNGFTLYVSFRSTDPNVEVAHRLVRDYGVYEGSYR